jgi:energy-coupling factor transport system ATP-binding protein
MLAMQSPVLVLDEPTASLDPAGKLSVFNVLAQLRRDHQITILMATQELDRIARFADRIIVLHNGKIAMSGSPLEVFAQSSRLQEWGVGVPQLVELGDTLSNRTGHTYRFTGMADAYKQLLRQALKAKQKGIEARHVRLPAPRTNPLGGRAQIVIDHLSHVYADGTSALSDVSLTLHPGDFVALLGANGAGKSTLAKHLNGLLKPSSGSVIVEHIDTRTSDVATLARLVGYSFQNPDHQIFAPTVEEELAFGPRVQGLPADRVGQYVAESLARFQLQPYAHLPPALLGFGQRRQVALAATLAPQPRILILDEPTGGLDAQSRREFMDILAALNAQGRTIVLITHDMRIVAEYASRVIVLVSGTVLYDGAPRALFRQPDLLRRSGLSVPQVTRLARRLREVGLTPDVLTISEFALAWRRLLSEPDQKPAKAKRQHAHDESHAEACDDW